MGRDESFSGAGLLKNIVLHILARTIIAAQHVYKRFHDMLKTSIKIKEEQVPRLCETGYC